MAKVLVVDDEMTMVQMVSELLRSEGHQVVPFTSYANARESLATVAPELVIANLGAQRNGAGPMGILQKARELDPQPLMIMVTPAAATESNLEYIKRGAYDYLNKPFTPEELKLRVQRALSYQDAVRENSSLQKQLQSGSPIPQIVGSSAAIRDLLNLVERIADRDGSLLICGPRGSGKRFFARTIHGKSRRRFAPFVPFSCGTLPENLLEVELFGQRKSLFSGSQGDASGLFRDANGGTVLLDDIGALTIPLQSRLVTLLEHRRIEVPGDSTPVDIDVRLLAATRDNLQEKVARGEVLPELYQRLAEVCLTLPPLKERAEDITLLIAHFLEGKIHPRSGRPYEIAREAIDACQIYEWPGNVRELENALVHACMVCREGLIQVSDLPLEVREPISTAQAGRSPRQINVDGIHAAQLGLAHRIQPFEPHPPDASAQMVPLKRFLRDQEIEYLQKTLARVGGSKERAAEVLGISLATIYRKLAEPSPADATVSF